MALVTHQLLSPAKINLMLRVLNQRTDGYHDLQTCFQLLDWGDEVHIAPFDCEIPNQIQINGFGDLELKDNLIYQAATLLRPHAKNKLSWTVTVNKNIPMGAGLGGGSSNAGLMLRFLNQHWACNLSTNDLLELAISLGADVPLFVLNQSALAGGVGEQLMPMEFNTPYVLLLFPGCAINTAKLFSSFDLQRNQSCLKTSHLTEQSFWINDFFPVALNRFSEVRFVYNELKYQMDLRLSGTGSTLFALFDDMQSAEQALAKAQSICGAVLTRPLSA